MKRTAPALVFALACATAFAQAGNEDHAGHHPPAGPEAATAAPPAPRATPPAGERFAGQMKQMQDLHQRIQAAKTPADRQALMDEQMKLMQSGMAMMGQMGAAGPAGDGPQGAMTMGASGAGGMMGMHDAMQRRLSMMEMMMQMMVDREAAIPRR